MRSRAESPDANPQLWAGIPSSEAGKMSIKYIDYLKPSKATGLVAEVFKQVRRDFGQVVEPLPFPRSIGVPGALMLTQLCLLD